MTSGQCVIGIETEYAFAALGPDGHCLDQSASADALFAVLRSQHPYLHGQSETDLYIANGSRLYLDVGLHPECASPECNSPEEAVRYTRAGDLILASAARELERRRGEEGIRILVWKGNVDHRSRSTWASHESYLHRVAQSILAEQIISHLATRVIYTGAGGFDNLSPTLRFVVSPRAFHLQQAVSSDSTARRGIFHTRDEPLCAPPYRRLHVLAGESVWSETADYLRFGTTALLVAQIDAGRRPQAGLDLEQPVQALAAIAADLDCTATVALRNGRRLSAIEIQRRLLRGVEADLGCRHLPPWADAVCRLWRLVLDRLEASPESLIGILDWPTKLATLRRQAEARGLEQAVSGTARDAGNDRLGERMRQISAGDDSAPLLEMEMRFNLLDETGIFATLDRVGVSTHRIVVPATIAQAMDEPPPRGRARIRGSFVRQLAARRHEISCNWHRIVDHQRELLLDLADPFRGDDVTWSVAPSATSSAPPVLPAGIAGVDQAMRAGTPRQALRQIRAMASNPVRMSPVTIRYCVGVLGQLVPGVPVPVLRRGAATAGPVLRALLAQASTLGHFGLESRIGGLLTHWYEARGDFAKASAVFVTLLARATELGARSDMASMSNNLGYEYALAEDWERAMTLFQKAIALHEETGATRNLVNARTNLVACRFAIGGPDERELLLPEIRDLNRELTAYGDWRVRKARRMFATHAENTGALYSARAWARRAVAASEGIPTQLRAWDLAYLRTLQRP